MNNKKIEILIIFVIIFIQTVIYICVGTNKEYLHIDEAYSYGLTNYNKIEIENNEDFYNTWHEKEYYEDYLSIQKDEIGNLIPVYENQKNDVHPPLYYLLLRFAMNFTIEHFSKWTGIGLNIVIYAFATIFMYLILKKLLQNEKYSKEKAIILAFISSIVLASLTNVTYIRMYALLTLEIFITTFLHIKLLENEKTELKLLIGTGISMLAGILTHYYYLFYLAFIYLIFFIKYVKEKRIKELIHYTITMIIAVSISLIIFPYSIQHILYGYRGQGTISKLTNVNEFVPSILEQIHNLNYYGFNNLLCIIVFMVIAIIVYSLFRKKGMPKLCKEQKDIFKIICIPSIFFFLIATIVSPWNVLRYIAPVCGFIFVLVIYYLYKLLQHGFSEKISNIFICILLSMILITPFMFHMEPELLYNDRKEIVQKLSQDFNLPTVYLYNSQNGGFLHDIQIFSIIDASYIAKDVNYTEENIKSILNGKDISNGIIILINDGQNNEVIINIVKKTLNFENCNHLQRLWSCDVYYIN